MAADARWSEDDFQRLSAALRASLEEDGITVDFIVKNTEGVSSGTVHTVLRGRYYPRGIPGSIREIARVAGWAPGWVAKVLDGTEREPPPNRTPLIRSAPLPTPTPGRLKEVLDRAIGGLDVEIENLSTSEALDLVSRLLTMVAERIQASGEPEG